MQQNTYLPLALRPLRFVLGEQHLNLNTGLQRSCFRHSRKDFRKILLNLHEPPFLLFVCQPILFHVMDIGKIKLSVCSLGGKNDTF